MKKYFWIIVLTVFFIPARAQIKIIQYEYWFNNDYPGVVRQTVTPTPVLNLNQNLDVSSLSYGLHTVNYRFKDERGVWSGVMPRFFTRYPSNVAPDLKEITAYQYWYDNDFASATTQNITPTAIFNLNQTLNVSSLSFGLHTVCYRFRDERGVWSGVMPRFFTRYPSNVSPELKEITAYQYWYDTDYASAVTQTIAPAAVFNLNQTLDVSSLSYGLHTVCYRFRDERGVWSGVMPRFFVRYRSDVAPELKEITAYQYWYNNDYASAVTQTVTPTSVFNLNQTLDVSSLSYGLHTVCYRFRDERGVWSAVMPRFFTRYPVTVVPDLKEITAYQYWYDTDYTSAVTQTVTPTAVLNLDQPLNVSSLSNGLHIINYRFRDERGVWSTVMPRFFIYSGSAAQGNANPLITAYRCWFDGDKTTLKSYAITPPAKTCQINDSILTPILQTGDHTIGIQLKDNLGQWSSAIIDTFNVSYARGGAITGILTYNNVASTPLDSVWAVLKMDGTRIDSVRTTLTGRFTFVPKLNGAYTLYPSTGKPWAGVNGTDAIKIQRHFAGLEYLSTPVRLLAADVNLSYSINGTDAVKVKRRFAGLEPTFLRGDWTFAKPTGGDTIVISGGNVSQDFQGLCVGDVNGSNNPVPGDSPNSVSVMLNHNGEIEVSPGQEFILPIRISNPGLVSAISFVIPYPEELLEVLDVKTPAGSPAYTAKNGQIRMAWSELQSLYLKEGDILLTLKLKATKNFTGNKAIDLAATNESELADETGTAIPLAELYTQSIKTLDITGTKDPNSILQQCAIYPNPVSNILNIELTTTQNAMLNMEITDMLGRVRTNKQMGELMPGQNTFRISTTDLVNGVYTIRLSLEGESGKSSHLNKVVVSR